MRKNHDKIDHEFEIKLLRERLWDLDDKVSVMREATAEQAVEIIRLRQLTNLLLEKLERASLSGHTERPRRGR